MRLTKKSIKLLVFLFLSLFVVGCISSTNTTNNYLKYQFMCDSCFKTFDYNEETQTLVMEWKDGLKGIGRYNGKKYLIMYFNNGENVKIVPGEGKIYYIIFNNGERFKF